MVQPKELTFKGSNPGAVQFGNFINYYQFHPPENRIKLLPKDIWETPENQTFYALDLGCNSGDLTIAIHNLLTENVTKDTSILGVDIDPILIERSKEKNQSKNISFDCLDFMIENDRQRIVNYLKDRNLDRFNAVFCFSITMWIHLNYGDEGLKSFLKSVSQLGDLIIIEPQPWKCYRTAVKRLKLEKAEFPLFKQLEIRGNVEKEIENYLIKECGGVQKIRETVPTEWNRKILVFKRNN